MVRAVGVAVIEGMEAVDEQVNGIGLLRLVLVSGGPCRIGGTVALRWA
ncbi:hypothetical protein [Aquisalimonas sp.]|nr:hypothetical protein [Aquisalimonas sp.]